MLKHKPADSPDSDAAFLEKMKGYFVLQLAPSSDGLPKYSLGALAPAIGLTSFRGQMLEDCYRLLADHEYVLAWSHMAPADAVEFGQSLLAAAARARRGELLPDEPAPPAAAQPKKRFLGLLKAEPAAPDYAQQFWERRRRGGLSIEEQIDIVGTAGRWYVFWGSRGHPIHAYF